MRVVIGNVEQEVSVAAALTCPRLGFMDNYFCAFQAFSALGIPIAKSTGAFWDQSMSKLLAEQSQEERGYEFIVTMDYDSVFEPECVSRLISFAMISGYDAIAPLQTKRDDQRLLFTPKGHGDKSGTISLSAEWFEKHVQPVDTAHFGLTVLRCSALRRMPQPWFLGTPNEHGNWEDVDEGKVGRVDPDIHFWKSWRNCGNTVGVCPQVAIGHAELVITWPDRKLKGVHQYPKDFWDNGGRRPPEAWGSPEHIKKSEVEASLK